MHRLQRRQFVQNSLLLAGLGLLAGCAPQVQPRKVPRIGYLAPRSGPIEFDEGFRRGMRELGYVEGETVAIEWRFADGGEEAVRAAAAELVGLNVDVLVATSSAIPIAKEATATIPIVMALSGDPVGDGLVASLARPGGNITGMSIVSAQLSAKRLELLKEAFPHVARVAVLRNAANPSSGPQLRETEAIARPLGLEVHASEVRSPDELEPAFSAAGAARAGALLLLSDAFTTTHRKRIAELALRGRLPSMSPARLYTEAGGLMSYGPNLIDTSRRSATHVDRILKGARPAEIPVEQPTTFEFVINLRTAQALGVSLPQAVLQQATELMN